MAVFEKWRRSRPDAGIVVGTIRVHAGERRYDVQFGHVDCCPVALVASASELLTAALEKMLAGDVDDLVRDLVARIEQARAALDFEEPEAVQ